MSYIRLIVVIPVALALALAYALHAAFNVLRIQSLRAVQRLNEALRMLDPEGGW